MDFFQYEIYIIFEKMITFLKEYLACEIVNFCILLYVFPFRYEFIFPFFIKYF